MVDIKHLPSSVVECLKTTDWTCNSQMARHSLKRPTSVGILSLLIRPIRSGRARFISGKLYLACKRCLTEGGILLTQNGVPFVQGEVRTVSTVSVRISRCLVLHGSGTDPGAA